MGLREHGRELKRAGSTPERRLRLQQLGIWSKHVRMRPGFAQDLGEDLVLAGREIRNLFELANRGCDQGVRKPLPGLDVVPDIAPELQVRILWEVPRLPGFATRTKKPTPLMARNGSSPHVSSSSSRISKITSGIPKVIEKGRPDGSGAKPQQAQGSPAARPPIFVRLARETFDLVISELVLPSLCDTGQCRLVPTRARYMVLSRSDPGWRCWPGES